MKTMNELERPFYAFNKEFEEGVLFHFLGMEIKFEGELQAREREPKYYAVRELGISNYDDPFNDSGFKCMKAWTKGEIDKAIAHNRSCLLKEKDILLKRGSLY
jgi:hypothetical protein